MLQLRTWYHITRVWRPAVLPAISDPCGAAQTCPSAGNRSLQQVILTRLPFCIKPLNMQTWEQSACGIVLTRFTFVQRALVHENIINKLSGPQAVQGDPDLAEDRPSDGAGGADADGSTPVEAMQLAHQSAIMFLISLPDTIRRLGRGPSGHANSDRSPTNRQAKPAGVVKDEEPRTDVITGGKRQQLTKHVGQNLDPEQR